MKIPVRLVLAYTGLVFLTFGYGWLAGLGLSISKILMSPDLEQNLPWITRITATSPQVWQILAGVSLVLNFIWGVTRHHRLGTPEAHTLPIACHLGWVLMSFCWNSIGALNPYLLVAYALVPQGL